MVNIARLEELREKYNRRETVRIHEFICDYLQDCSDLEFEYISILFNKNKQGRRLSENESINYLKFLAEPDQSLEKSCNIQSIANSIRNSKFINLIKNEELKKIILSNNKKTLEDVVKGRKSKELTYEFFDLFNKLNHIYHDLLFATTYCQARYTGSFFEEHLDWLAEQNKIIFFPISFLPHALFFKKDFSETPALNIYELFHSSDISSKNKNIKIRINIFDKDADLNTLGSEYLKRLMNPRLKEFLEKSFRARVIKEDLECDLTSLFSRYYINSILIENKNEATEKLFSKRYKLYITLLKKIIKKLENSNILTTSDNYNKNLCPICRKYPRVIQKNRNKKCKYCIELMELLKIAYKYSKDTARKKLENPPKKISLFEYLNRILVKEKTFLNEDQKERVEKLIKKLYLDLNS